LSHKKLTIKIRSFAALRVSQTVISLGTDFSSTSKLLQKFGQKKRRSSVETLLKLNYFF